MDEVIKKLESVNTQDSSRAVSRLQKRLSSSREPHLLGELVDYFIASGSKQALKVLSSLKDIQSQVRCRGEVLVQRKGESRLFGRVYRPSTHPVSFPCLSSLQDFFSKLNECMQSKVPMRVPVLRLLAHCLNKQVCDKYLLIRDHSASLIW